MPRQEQESVAVFSLMHPLLCPGPQQVYFYFKNSEVDSLTFQLTMRYNSTEVRTSGSRRGDALGKTSNNCGCKVCLVTLDGCPYVADLDGLAQGSVPFPEGGVHVYIRPAVTEVSDTAGEGPQLVNIDCTGLGGHDLGGFKDYDICLRTDKHSQSIYGPSVTPMESPGQDGVHQVTLVALGGSKAMQEFLVLHYLATDSASEWDVFLDSCLPKCAWVRAGLPSICMTSAILPHLLDGSLILHGLQELS